MRDTTRFIAVFAALCLLTGCPSTQSLCKSGVDQVCERSFECQPDAVKSSAAFQAGFGTSVDECKTKLYAAPGPGALPCDEVKTDPQLCANLGQPNATSFELGKASDCKDARAKLPCEDYLAQLADPTRAPTSCAQRCK